MIMNCEKKKEAPAQWWIGLWRGSAAVSVLGLRVRIPPEDWTSVSYELLSTVMYKFPHRPITRPEGS